MDALKDVQITADAPFGVRNIDVAPSSNIDSPSLQLTEVNIPSSEKDIASQAHVKVSCFSSWILNLTQVFISFSIFSMISIDVSYSLLLSS